MAWTLNWRFCSESSWPTEKCCKLGQMADGEEGEEADGSHEVLVPGQVS